jgi:hypothetical protein
MVSNAVDELLDIEYAKGRRERQGASVREEGDLDVVSGKNWGGTRSSGELYEGISVFLLEEV